MQYKSAIILLASASACRGWSRSSWAPENAASVDVSTLPLNYSPEELQLASYLAASSWWTSSYLTVSNGHRYFLISHVLSATFTNSTIARTSILDVDNPRSLYSYYVTQIPNGTQETSGHLDIDTGVIGYKGLSKDSFSQQNFYFNTPDFSYNITWDTTATKPLLHAGGLSFNWGTGNTTEYGFPSCATTGSLNVNGTDLTIDSTKSFTWYDRQISNGGPLGNTTWWQLNFADGMRASVWAIDSAEPFPRTLRFATVRDKFGGQHIIPVTIVIDNSHNWVSPQSNRTYPQRWSFEFANGDKLNIKSVRDDQEMYSPGPLSNTLYEGYMTAEGSFMGQHSAFGVVEMAWV